MTPADKLIRVGFFAQILLLILLDWASLSAFRKEGVPWYHVVGFAVVNIVLIFAAALMWNWMKGRSSE
jgi:hypothetical protein